MFKTILAHVQCAGECSHVLLEVFVFNTNLAFLYKIDIEGFKNVSAKLKLPPVGIELTTPTIKGLEGR